VFQSLEYASSRSKDLAHFCTFSETFQQAGPTLQNKTWIAACNFFGIPEVGAKPGEEVASAKAWWVIRFYFFAPSVQNRSICIRVVIVGFVEKPLFNSRKEWR
jgi:hypothetical protein